MAEEAAGAAKVPTAKSWTNLGKDSPAKKKKKKEEDLEEGEIDKSGQDMEMADPGTTREEEAAAKSQSLSGKSTKGKGKGKGKKGGKTMAMEKNEFEESIKKKKKMELLEMLVKKQARLAEIHDSEIRDLAATTDMKTYIIPESHPAVDAMKDRYQAYMEWIDELKAEAKTAKKEFVSPIGPQPALLQAVLERMQQEAKEAQDDTKVKELEEHIKMTKELTAETAAQVIPILRMTRCFSKPTRPMNWKVKIRCRTQCGMTSTLNTFFATQGGVRKTGVAPRGAATRQVSTLLQALEAADNEVWW